MKTFKEQFDTLTTAYISNKVQPYIECACFIGNMLDGNPMWAQCRSIFNNVTPKQRTSVNDESLFHYGLIVNRSIDFVESQGYTAAEIAALEDNFLQIIAANTPWETLSEEDRTGLIGVNSLERIETHYRTIGSPYHEIHSNFEEALFLAFESTLDMLKTIHIAKGEVIDEIPAFVKRQPVMA